MRMRMSIWPLMCLVGMIMAGGCAIGFSGDRTGKFGLSCPVFSLNVETACKGTYTPAIPATEIKAVQPATIQTQTSSASPPVEKGAEAKPSVSMSNKTGECGGLTVETSSGHDWG